MKSLNGLLFVPMVMLSSLSAKETPSTAILRKVTSIHTRVYGLENLLIKPFTKTKTENDIDSWRALMTECGKFMGANGDKNVNLQLMAILNGASETIINLRKIYFNNVIKPALSSDCKTDGLNKIDKNKIDFAKINFTKLKSDLAKATAEDIHAVQDVQQDAKNIVGLIGNSKDKQNLAERESLSIISTLGI
ncbi:MAG: hypothetical protein P4L36_03520, partial [Holophaga sp.]|nr:hypothetical protein [Holophaga sp.]